MPDVTILARDVPLDDSLRASFHDGGEAVFGKWGPSGTAASVGVHVHRLPGMDHDLIDVTLDCDGRAAFLTRILPVPLSRATGRVEIVDKVVRGEIGTVVRLTDVAAEGDGFTIRVSGEVHDDADGHAEDLVVRVDSPDAGGGVRAAALAADPGTIHEGVKDAVRKLGATGPIGIVAHIRKGTDGKNHDRVEITLRGTAVAGWDDIPLAARNLAGLAVVEKDTLTLEDVSGTFVMGDRSPPFTATGRLLELSSGKPQFDVHVESPEIPLGESLRTALGPLAEKAQAFWDRINPVPAAHAAVVLDLRPDADPKPFEVRLTGIHGGLRPLGLELDCDDGTRVPVRELGGVSRSKTCRDGIAATLRRGVRLRRQSGRGADAVCWIGC